MNVQSTSITVMPMLSVITLRDLLTAHAVLDILEMEHPAPVNRNAYYLLYHNMRSEIETTQLNLKSANLSPYNIV